MAGSNTSLLRRIVRPRAALLMVAVAGTVEARVWAVREGRLARIDVALGARTLDGRVEIVGPLPADVDLVASRVEGEVDGRRVRLVRGAVNLAARDIAHDLVRFVPTCIGRALLLGVVQSMVGIYRGLVE